MRQDVPRGGRNGRANRNRSSRATSLCRRSGSRRPLKHRYEESVSQGRPHSAGNANDNGRDVSGKGTVVDNAQGRRWHYPCRGGCRGAKYGSREQINTPTRRPSCPVERLRRQGRDRRRRVVWAAIRGEPRVVGSPLRLQFVRGGQGRDRVGRRARCPYRSPMLPLNVQMVWWGVRKGVGRGGGPSGVVRHICRLRFFGEGGGSVLVGRYGSRRNQRRVDCPIRPFRRSLCMQFCWLLAVSG